MDVFFATNRMVDDYVREEELQDGKIVREVPLVRCVARYLVLGSVAHLLAFSTRVAALFIPTLFLFLFSLSKEAVGNILQYAKSLQ